MQRFFCEVIKEPLMLKEEDKDHITKSLRMKKGERLVVCDGRLNDYICEIKDIKKDFVLLDILEQVKNKAEPSLDIYLYQAIPKFSKFEFIIQKAVELGVKNITPIFSRRCARNINSENVCKKINRFNKIAKQAAQQSGRGLIPKVSGVISFADAIKEMNKFDLNILFYEYGKETLNNINLNDKTKIGVVIGSEGGFEEDEVDFAKNMGVFIGSLGGRILRCETAPICAISVLMYLTGNL